MHRKLLSAALAAAMTLTLAACGTDEGADNPDAYTVGICEQLEHVSLSEATRGFKDGLVEIFGEDGVVFANATSAETTFDMPAKDVTVRAEFENIEYTVTVKGGLCNIGEIEQESTMKVAYGQNVNLHAGKPVGKRFVKWTCDNPDVDFGNENNETTYFTMPASDVTVTAVFEDIDYTVTVTDGTADKTTAHYGDTVKITADTAPAGQTFDRWEITGIDTASLDLTQAELTFTVGTADIAAKATYKYIDYTVTVVGGTGGGVYKEGDSVTVTAAEPEEGKVFKGWQDVDGNIVSTDMSYTFTVSGEVSLTAVYEDKPDGGETGGETDGETGGETGGNITPAPEKKGLGGGAIAGIVIASVAVVGMGGFAIFWFVIKKKSFADLIAAIKKPFTKK